MSDNNLCPICKTNLANRWTTVDVHSDTDIPCCAECSDMMYEATRYQWYHNMPKKWQAEHKERLDNAWDALLAQYERDAAAKGKS